MRPVKTLKKRKQQRGDLACEGRISLFVGKQTRAKIEVIAGFEKCSMASLARLSLTWLIDFYSSNHKLPDVQGEDHKGKGPGRPRVFDKFRGTENE